MRPEAYRKASFVQGGEGSMNDTLEGSLGYVIRELQSMVRQIRYPTFQPLTLEELGVQLEGLGRELEKIKLRVGREFPAGVKDADEDFGTRDANILDVL